MLLIIRIMTNILTSQNIMNLDKYFLENIDKQANLNIQEESMNIYKNKNIYPPFRIYKDSSHLNLIPKIFPDYDMTYDNKQIFPPEKPIQTENDEEQISTSILNKFSGYTDYGNYKYQNQNLPEKLAHKKLPDYYKYDLFY